MLLGWSLIRSSGGLPQGGLLMLSGGLSSGHLEVSHRLIREVSYSLNLIRVVSHQVIRRSLIREVSQSYQGGLIRSSDGLSLGGSLNLIRVVSHQVIRGRSLNLIREVSYS